MNNALIAMQGAITPDEFWKAAYDLMHAAMPTRFVALGLSSLGIMPIYLRTTMPTRDIGRFGELAPLGKVVATNPGLKVARMSDFYTAQPGDPFYRGVPRAGWLDALGGVPLLDTGRTFHRASRVTSVF
ncbi:MAG: hypothetical protein QM760_01415 [Nibricoccus sp.]